jgi:NADH-quinone oxidoreductase subunit I
MKRREELTFLERIYVVEVLKGVWLTFGRLLRNFIRHLKNSIWVRGDNQKLKGAATIQYPEQMRAYPERYRARHRLTLKENGDVKCTACFLCATACPARCIYIEPAEHSDSSIEKFPHRYEIDTLLCIYCGYCVEACPVDAIRMDTGLHPEVYPPDPRLYIEDKETLMERSRILEDIGKEGLLELHRAKIRSLEQGSKPLSDAVRKIVR